MLNGFLSLSADNCPSNPIVTDTPNIGQTDDPIEQEIPNLYPSCAVTRAMAKKAILKNSNSDIDLTDTFIGQYFNNKIKKSLDPSLSDTQSRQCLVIHHHGLLTKVTTHCQSHSLSRNSKLILSFKINF